MTETVKDINFAATLTQDEPVPGRFQQQETGGESNPRFRGRGKRNLKNQSGQYMTRMSIGN
jgi:hypothetical protein